MDVAFQQGFASALLDVVFGRVADKFMAELEKIRDVDENVQKLTLSVVKVRVQVRKMDLSKQSQFQGNEIKALKSYFDSLIPLCFEVKDFMDDIARKIEEYNSKSSKKTWSLYRIIKRRPKWLRMPSSADKLVKKLDAVELQLQSIINIVTPDGSSNLNSETPLVRQRKHVLKIPLVGRDNDVQNIIDRLIQCNAFTGVSIVGMVGLGKTGLAQAIVNDGKTVGAFPNIHWVSVTNGCLKEEWLVKFVQDLDDKPSSSFDKKMLIIFDNLLMVTASDWRNFLNAARQSRRNVVFLITTRYPGISEVTCTSLYNLSLLSPEACETIVRMQVQRSKVNLSESVLSVAAPILASKCGGLPLVANSLSIALATRCSDWRTLLEKDLWELDEFKSQVLPKLNSIYEEMNADMKECFAFFSLFPWNHNFITADMVHLWVGAGFIQNDNSSSRRDLNDLLHVNEQLGAWLLPPQIPDGATDTETTRFQLHEFSHKFAQSAGSVIYKRLDNGTSSLANTVSQSEIRHLSILSEKIEPEIWSSMKHFEHLSTILSVCPLENVKGQLGKIPRDLFKSLRRIRVLALNNTDVVELPTSVSKLKQLRFLDISNTLIKSLPKKLSKLQSLQILKCKKTELTRLPQDLHELRNLLCLEWDPSRQDPPPNMGRLVSLQNLPEYPVEQTKGRSITELQNMNGLRGSIRITKLENVKDEEEAKKAMLKKKSSLREITLQWDGSSQDSIARSVLNGLKPPICLEKLKITHYGGNMFPEWISHPFLRVEEIHLKRCRACNVLPALGQLPILKILILQDMRSFTSVDTSLCGHFPALQRLTFKNMGALESWRGLEANDMQHLRHLNLINCPKFVCFPSLDNLTSLEDVHIELCEVLGSLPELPTSLQSLTISRSPQLTVECKDGGKEWLKINSVKNVVIDNQKIETGAKPHNSLKIFALFYFLVFFSIYFFHMWWSQ